MYWKGVYPVGVWVCLQGAGSASCAEICLWVRCEQSQSADRPAESPAVMLYHVGWYLLLGCLLLDLEGRHVLGQRRRKGKVLPGVTLFFTVLHRYKGGCVMLCTPLHTMWWCFYWLLWAEHVLLFQHGWYLCDSLIWQLHLLRIWLWGWKFRVAPIAI